MSSNLIALLPEIVLILAGVLIMLAAPSLPAHSSRKPLGWLAVFATLLAAWTSWVQLQTLRSQNLPITAYSGSIRVDGFSIFFHLLLAAIALVSLLGSLDFFERSADPEHPESHAGEYFALLLFGTAGAMLMTCSVELLVVFVGLEISSISSYILCAFRKGQARGAESSLKYFLLGSFSTAFFLYGIALAFGATGSTSIPAIATALLSGTATPYLALLALAMLVIGLGFKVSAAPFQIWTPDVYQGAPAPVVGFMSTAPKAAAFAILLRLTFTGFASVEPRWSVLLWIMAALSMFAGNLGALRQTSVKRMLAYSSIAHAGYLLAAFTALPGNGISAACFYTATYAAMNLGAFAVVTQLAGPMEHHRTIADFQGMALRRPVLGAVFAFFLLSLIGIPFTGGFFGKFYVFSAVVGAHHIGLAVVGLLNSGIACFYYLRLLAALYTRHPDAAGNERIRYTRTSIPAMAGLTLSAIATLALGIFPGPVLHFTEAAARSITASASNQPCASAGESCQQGSQHP